MIWHSSSPKITQGAWSRWGAGYFADVALGLQARGLDVVLTDSFATSFFFPMPN
jgi:hypothetical protein